MNKISENLQPINEVSKILDLPQHVLRFWETRFTQLRPVKRKGGQRYYRSNDIDALRGIQYLLYEKGYTIRAVQALFSENGVAAIAAVGRHEDGAMQKLNCDKVIGGAEIEPKKTSSGFLGFFNSNNSLIGSKRSKKSDQNTILNEVLAELIQCKRILDRGRR